MIGVLVVDDHVVVRSGLEQLLSMSDDITIVGVAASGAEAVEQAERLAPDVVLMDLSMPGMDGVDATRKIVDMNPNIRVLVLTSFSDQNRILDVLAAGAQGYLLKHAEPDEIAQAIRAVHRGDSPLDPRAARVLLDSRRSTRDTVALTDREREVLLLLREGLPNKRIASRLGISERTVKAHMTSIFQRIGVTDRTQAALWAREHLPSS